MADLKTRLKRRLERHDTITLADPEERATMWLMLRGNSDKYNLKLGRDSMTIGLKEKVKR